jgi:hypothetical protein
MITTSENIDALAAAMATAQTTIEGALKDSANPHFKSKYADLSAVWTAWQKVGPFNGLAVMQFPGECDNGRMAMDTLITHKSGQWIKGTLSIPLPKVDAQGYGSATTYARRYALAAAVGIAPEDDDGNAASAAKGAANDAPALINDADWAMLVTLIEQTGSNAEKLCVHYKIASLKHMTAAIYPNAIRVLQGKINDRSRVAA